MNSPNIAVLDGDMTSTSVSYPLLRNSVKEALEDYLSQLDDQSPANLYELVLAQIEMPLLEVVMRLTKNNQSQAAKLLGLSRGTLRKKLKQYNLE